jgi:hypothetical protein
VWGLGSVWSPQFPTFGELERFRKVFGGWPKPHHLITAQAPYLSYGCYSAVAIVFQVLLGRAMLSEEACATVGVVEEHAENIILRPVHFSKGGSD